MENMNNVPAYGLWGLVIINSLIFIIFAFSFTVRIQVEERGMREGVAKSQEWAEIASRKKAIAERA